MKKNLIFTVSLIGNLLLSQVGINTDRPHQSAALDIQSEETGRNKKGILIPRVQLINTADITNNPARGLLVYNTITQNDVLKDNFYYFDGNKWNAILSENENTNVPLLAVVARLEKDINVNSPKTRIPITFNKMVVNNSNLISYDKSTGLFTVNSEGIYGITLQLGVVNYSVSEMILGIANEEDKWIGRSTFYQYKLTDTKARPAESRLSKVYSTYLNFKKGDKFKACFYTYRIDNMNQRPAIQGIQTGDSGNGNVTNISIIKY